MENSEQLSQFITACDNMVASKFILVNKRISDILKSIATTPAVYNAIAENMINFNFSYAYSTATAKTGELSVPSGRLIAFVFCLLKAIDDRKININDLLVRHFASIDNASTNYSAFCEQLIVPFKNKIIERLSGNLKNKTKKQSKTQNADISTASNKELTSRLLFLVKDVKAYIVGLKKFKAVVTKTQYLDLVDAFIKALERQDQVYYLVFANTLNALCRDKEVINRLSGIISLCGEVK